MLSTVEQIVLKAAINGKHCEEEIEKVVRFCFYKFDFESEILKVQLKTAKSIIRTASDDRFETFHDVRKAVMNLNKPARC